MLYVNKFLGVLTFDYHRGIILMFIITNIVAIIIFVAINILIFCIVYVLVVYVLLKCVNRNIPGLGSHKTNVIEVVSAENHLKKPRDWAKENRQACTSTLTSIFELRYLDTTAWTGN